VEQAISTFGLVHGKLHNRLGVAKAAKLVFTYRVLNVNIASDSDMKMTIIRLPIMTNHMHCKLIVCSVTLIKFTFVYNSFALFL